MLNKNNPSKLKPVHQHNHNLFVVGTSVFMVAFVGSLLTDMSAWYINLPKVPFQPPNWIFGPVWSGLFLLIAWAAVIIANTHHEERNLALYVFGVNGVLNVLWSFLFFTLKDLQKSSFEILIFWLSIVLMIALSSKISKKAAWLLAPYLIWVSFAAYLNFTFWIAK